VPVTTQRGLEFLVVGGLALGNSKGDDGNNTGSRILSQCLTVCTLIIFCSALKDLIQVVTPKN